MKEPAIMTKTYTKALTKFESKSKELDAIKNQYLNKKAFLYSDFADPISPENIESPVKRVVSEL